MSKGVADDAVSLAPERFGDRHFHCGAHLDGMVKGAVDIVELEQQHDRWAAQSGGRERSQFGDLFAEEELVGSNRKFHKKDAAVR
jgi:hypothetical protein